MKTTTAPILVSSFARFVQGDIKGGAHAHAFRIDTMRTAIEQAFKGNYSPLTEAQPLAVGKAKKTRAYAAGFAVLGTIGTIDGNGVGIKKVDYIGALNSADNKTARERIASLTEVHTNAFFVAFDAIMAEKAEKKEPKDAPAPAPASAPVAEITDDTVMTADDAESDTVDVDLDDLVRTIANAISSGMLTTDQRTALAKSLATYEAWEDGRITDNDAVIQNELVQEMLADVPVFEEVE